MAPELVPLLLFAMISLATAALLMFLRDLFRRNTDNRMGAAESLTIERLPTGNEPAPRGPLQRFDRWFGKLVGETGLQLAPQAAFLLAVAAGLLLGGGLFLWRESMLAASVGMAVGFFSVSFFYSYQRSRRRRLVQSQLPPSMELMARSVRAGQSVDQAIEMAADMADEPMATEFRRCFKQMEMGLPLESAVQAMARRVPIMETRILASTLAVQRRAGGSLPNALLRLARSFRDRLEYQLRHRAATAAARGSAFVITAAALGAASYMAIFQPELARNFVESWQGVAMLTTAILLLLVGLVWIWQLLKVDY